MHSYVLQNELLQCMKGMKCLVYAFLVAADINKMVM